MDLLLQVWGGGLYLLNKIFFAFAEGKQESLKRKLRIVGWIVYLLGVPAWVILLVGQHDWIAASIEAGGVPAMLFGLVYVYQNTDRPHKGFDLLASLFTYSSLVFGVCYSVFDYGGLASVSQVLEIGVMVGFLMGSYLLAKKDYRGWVFFMLMNGSMASLMFYQDKPLLAVQQLVSLCFVCYGFVIAYRTVKKDTAQTC